MPVLNTKDGAALAYADDGAGPPVLLVHGWAAHHGFFSDLRAQLAKTHRVIAPTLRGHAGSGRGTAPLTVATLGDDIATLVEALDLRHVTAVGWSMGAMALWQAAPRVQDRIAALIVEEMSPKIVNDDDWRLGLAGAYCAANVEATLIEMTADWPAYVQRLCARMFSSTTRARRPALVRWAASEMAKADPEAMASLWRSMASADFRAQLPQLSMPVLAISGADSEIYPAGAVAHVAEAAAHGASIALKGAGHVPHLEAPELFFTHAAEFIQRTARRDGLREGMKP